MDKSKLTFEKGKVYYIICFTPACGGKTTFFNKLTEIYEEKHKDTYNLFYSSFDSLRADLAKEYRDSHPKFSYEEAYEKVFKEAIKLFDEQIMNFSIAKEANKINIILLDKNYYEGLEKFRKVFCKDTANHILVLIAPKTANPIETGYFKCPFSYDYVFQCYLRLRQRTSHEVLNWATPHSLYTFLSTVKAYQNFNVANEVVNAVNAHFIELDCFSDETSRGESGIEHSEAIKEFFSQFVFKMKPFDLSKAAKSEKEVSQFFDKVDSVYGKVYKETEQMIEGVISDLFFNGL